MTFHSQKDIIHSNTEIKELNIVQLMQNFGLSLVGVFIPIYFLQQGFDLFLVIAFIAFFSAMQSVFFPAAAFFTRRFKLKHTIVLSAPLYILFFSILYFFELNVVWLILLALFFAAARAFYWFPLQWDFTKNSHSEKSGNELNNFFLFAYAGHIIGPLAGALIIDSFLGFNGLFAVASFFLFLSFIPLFFTEDFKVKVKKKWNKSFSEKGKKYFMGSFVVGIFTNIFDILWPVFDYFLFMNVFDVGIVYSAYIIAFLLSALVIGRKISKRMEPRLMRLGAVLGILFLLLTIFISLQFDSFIFAFIFGFSSFLLLIPFRDNLFTYIKNTSVTGGLIHREIALGLGRVVSCIVLAVAILFFPLKDSLNAFYILFLFGAISLLYFTVKKIS